MGRIADMIKAKAVEIIVNDSHFVDHIANAVAINFDYSELTDHFNIDPRDIVDRVDEQEIVDAVFDKIDIDEVSDYIIDDLDYTAIYGKVGKLINKEELYKQIAEEIAQNL